MQGEFFVIWISLILWAIFAVMWTSKALKAYLWVLLGLLFCILIHLKLNSIVADGVANNMFDYFLKNNRNFFQSVAILALPMLAILVLINNSLSFKSINSSLWELLAASFMWLFILPFSLSLYYLIHSFDISTSSLLVSIIDFLKSTELLRILSDYEYLIFLLLFWVLLYKFLFSYLFLALVYFLNNIRKLRAEERENRRRYKEVDSDDEDNEEEDTNH